MNELEKQIQALVERHHKGEPGLSDQIKALREQLSAMICNGAVPCPDCGNMPHGMKQPLKVGNEIFTVFEVGCVVCSDHRARGLTREEAVQKWNAGEYKPAKDGNNG